MSSRSAPPPASPSSPWAPAARPRPPPMPAPTSTPWRSRKASTAAWRSRARSCRRAIPGTRSTTDATPACRTLSCATASPIPAPPRSGARLPSFDGHRRMPALMLQGTGSDVGKSLLVAGLGRALTRRGLAVRPFKPQNMSNNAAVTADGGEIGRAQALQARAARVPPSVHMNPVLLKPQSEIGAQVVVQGKVVGNAKAREYQAMKPKLLGAVLESFGKLAAEADLVLVEGAGSASQVNLRAAHIANMRCARAADGPVT